MVGRFAKVVSDKYTEYGLDKGDIVFVAGSGFAPVDDDDNYKLLFVGAKVVDGVPVQDKGITLARSSLKLVSATMEKKLQGKLQRAFPKAGPAAPAQAEEANRQEA